jgi:Tol biopolymer transport system component
MTGSALRLRVTGVMTALVLGAALFAPAGTRARAAGASPAAPGGRVDWGPVGSTTAVPGAGAGGGNVYRPWLSGDGRYLVFDSDGTRVIGTTPDTTKIRDVYLYDRMTGGVERVSVASDGSRAHIPRCRTPQPCGSQRPTISADGRYVAFWSNADNFDRRATSGHANAYVRDRVTGTTILLSPGFNGAEPNGDSRRPVISRDGRYVTFESAATNLVAPATRGGGRNKGDDVFVSELSTGTVTPVSTASDGRHGNGASNRPSLSGDGRKVVFASVATNLVSPPTAGTRQVFMKDLDSGATTLVSSTPAGIAGDRASTSPSISADGRWVSFDSQADNFNPADHNGDTDVYVKDIQTGVVEQVSIKNDGGQARAGTVKGADSTISADGRFVAFWSDSPDLVRKTTGRVADVYVRDRRLGTTTRVVATNGAAGDGNSYSPALSMDGRFVAFDSKATTLDPGAPGRGEKVFVHVND